MQGGGSIPSQAENAGRWFDGRDSSSTGRECRAVVRWQRQQQHRQRMQGGGSMAETAAAQAENAGRWFDDRDSSSTGRECRAVVR
ncbi:hypothetical protein ACOMHN_021359 [Nucella lapillus]